MLTVKEYFMIGMTSKHMHKLLKMELYKNILNDISKLKMINMALYI